MIGVLINLMVGLLSQFICMSNYHIVYFKYITISFVNYTSVRLEKKDSRSHHQDGVIIRTSCGPYTGAEASGSGRKSCESPVMKSE